MKISRMSCERADEIWDIVCYVGCDGNIFRTRDVIRGLQKCQSFAGSSQKGMEIAWSIFYQWALNNPHEFSGSKALLTRVAPGRWRLDDC